MSRRATLLIIATMLLLGSTEHALAEEKVSAQASTKDALTVSTTIPVTDEALHKLGVNTVKADDLVRAATLLSLVGAARTGGGGLPYTCTSESNECTCHGWLDCVLVMDECRTPPRNPDGTLCTGDRPCTCTWH